MTDRSWDAGYPGVLLLNALKELVLPLIAFALMVGVLNLRHTKAGCEPICSRPPDEKQCVVAM